MPTLGMANLNQYIYRRLLCIKIKINGKRLVVTMPIRECIWGNYVNMGMNIKEQARAYVMIPLMVVLFAPEIEVNVDIKKLKNFVNTHKKNN
jgi:hypothetical protein